MMLNFDEKKEKEFEKLFKNYRKELKKFFYKYVLIPEILELVKPVRPLRSFWIDNKGKIGFKALLIPSTRDKIIHKKFDRFEEVIYLFENNELKVKTKDDEPIVYKTYRFIGMFSDFLVYKEL